MYYFIVNPVAGRGDGEKIWKKLERHVRTLDISYEVRITGWRGEAREISSKWSASSQEPAVIVIIGGDGTVNEVLDGWSFHRPLTLGYIPSGSGNDLARSLRLPLRTSGAIKRILHPSGFRSMDYGILVYDQEIPIHRRFAVSSGIGLDAAVCHALLEKKRSRSVLGKRFCMLKYLVTGASQLLNSRPVRGYLVLDGVKKVEFNHIYFISVHIHPREGGGFQFAPHAEFDDGMLEVCIVHNASRLNLACTLADALVGRIGSHKGVRAYRCREMKIHMERPMPVHVDGESCQNQKDIHLRCIERKLRIIV